MNRPDYLAGTEVFLNSPARSCSHGRKSEVQRTQSRSCPFRRPNPAASVHPRVVAAGPGERFGIVAVDCAKARSKWLLADYYGLILIPPINVDHTRLGFKQAVTLLREAIETHGLRDLIVAIERTGAYHKPVRYGRSPSAASRFGSCIP